MTDEMDDDWDDEMELKAQAEMFARLESNEYRAFIQMSSDGNNVSEFWTASEAYGAKAMEPYFAAGRTSALAKALIGDMSELADLVRKGTLLNEGEREFTVALILGDLKPARGAKPKRELSKAISLSFFWISEFDKKGCNGARKDALYKCGKQFKLSKSSIEEHLKVGKTCVLTQEAIAGYRALLANPDHTFALYFREVDLKSG